ncbi:MULTISPECIES: hypothetical protein [unclassified Meiothermus]|uniref:hypothetical protein n=1 Tax=unclassified Meiothermus TaxID=370471 RepID=UPI000D7BBA4D|nr:MULTISPECIES: hypothetical protein [unclassified Meiothermus]PZA06098.1 hypothetical protein DNA98_15100 [Meiothermus sp. Pnk-1]RYM35372.1 hypothetical protein EWH23_11310 [Meiothermus sp. PNK-Is4]
MVPERILHDRLAFLAYFPAEQRSTGANLLLEAVRAGCSEPHQVVGFALERANRRHWSEAAHTLRLLAELDPEALLAGARWALWWEALPWAERQRLKAERATEALERHMQELPPTEKQLAYLHRLGHRGPVPISRLEASRLIDALLKGVNRAS